MTSNQSLWRSRSKAGGGWRMRSTPCPSAIGWRWSCATSRGCRTRKRPTRWVSRSAPRSQMSIAGSVCYGRHLMQNHRLFEELRALGRVHAPSEVLDNILDEVGLRDLYASLETALGPVYVAWNRLGVSAVMKTATPREFE